MPAVALVPSARTHSSLRVYLKSAGTFMAGFCRQLAADAVPDDGAHGGLCAGPERVSWVWRRIARVPCHAPTLPRRCWLTTRVNRRLFRGDQRGGPGYLRVSRPALLARAACPFGAWLPQT